MSREIKFRALNRATNEWYYGCPNPDESNPYEMVLWSFWIKVDEGILDPETVGQSIDLKDKNDKERYASDIEKSEDGGVYEIIWVQEWAGFFWRIIKKSKYEPGKIVTNIGEIVPLGRRNTEIIGNIHDKEAE